MKLRSAILPVSLTLLAYGSLQAQTTLVNWDQVWSFMHPTTGILPAGSGQATPHPAGTTPWFASQATFAASYTGPSFMTSGVGFEAGSSPGPIGYGGVDYFTNPLPPPAEFTALGRTLTPPASGSRYSAYFRTTFTVPNDGNTYTDPIIRYILDDGGFVYLDGVLILRVNVAAGAADDYLLLAANTTNTESHIRRAQLNLTAGTVTGGNDDVVPALAGNATVVQQVTSLAPGLHTLAVASHNAAIDSSDLVMAVQLKAGPANCALAGTVSNVTRNTAGTPNNSNDDTVGFTLNVVPTGVASASWKITGPPGSAALNKTGAYNTNVVITGVPIAEFSGAALSVLLEDSTDAFCNTRSTVFPPRIIGSFEQGANSEPIVSEGNVPVVGWVFDDVFRTLRMNNGGGGARQIVRSSVIDLTAIGEVLFTGALQIDDTSSGNEADDSFVAYLIIDGNAASPVNLITPHDTLIVDGVLTAFELASGVGSFVREFNHVIPAGANSVQIVIEGINNSGSETFLVRDLLLTAQAPAARLFFDVNASGNNLVFTWSSGGGLLYNLRSATTLDTAPIDWPIYMGQANMAATPPLNTLTLPRPAGATRFFVIESFPAPPVAILQDNFESGQGLWTAGSDGAAGTAWQLGTPTSGPGAANSPVNCFATNLAGPYGANADVWLRSPAIDLTTAGSATLRYYQYKDIDDGYHFGTVSVIDAGTNTMLGTITSPGSNLSWVEVVGAIPSGALGKSVKIEFRFTSDGIGAFPGWYIDDVRVTVP